MCWTSGQQNFNWWCSFSRWSFHGFHVIFFRLHSSTFGDKSSVSAFFFFFHLFRLLGGPYHLLNQLFQDWVDDWGRVCPLITQTPVDYPLVVADDEANSEGRDKVSSTPRLLSCTIVL
jgi:hypothetical protein